jgi:hypothetical protein
MQILGFNIPHSGGLLRLSLWRRGRFARLAAKFADRGLVTQAWNFRPRLGRRRLGLIAPPAPTAPAPAPPA